MRVVRSPVYYQYSLRADCGVASIGPILRWAGGGAGGRIRKGFLSTSASPLLEMEMGSGQWEAPHEYGAYTCNGGGVMGGACHFLAFDFGLRVC